MVKKQYRITESGQLVERTVSESVVSNPEAVLKTMKTLIDTPEPEVAPAPDDIQSYYNLGEGVCVHQQKFGQQLKTFGGIQLLEIPFYTTWELCEEAGVNEGNHFLVPSINNNNSIDLGAPLMLRIPEDLVMHFFIEWNHDETLNILKPSAGHLTNLPQHLLEGRVNYYLTCFSKSRNTCVRLPLPNLYDDCHLCTGTSFGADGFRDSLKHNGIVSSIKTTAEAWADSGWNLDLLGGTESLRMRQYRRFIRFDADSVSPLDFLGCTDWDLSTSAVPLEEVYRPWQADTRAIPPQCLEGEENLTNDGEVPVVEVEQPVAVNAIPVDGWAVAEEAGGPDANE